MCLLERLAGFLLSHQAARVVYLEVFFCWISPLIVIFSLFIKPFVVVLAFTANAS